MELLDRKTCYRAFQSHDARFDGRVFVGVTSTGIYCRPICPARTPKFENCRFFASAAAAQEAGFRPCLRCRPEIAPDLAFWRGTANTVSRALALIAEGALDEDEAGVEALAERLGVGGRQLRRLFQQHLGASPIAVAQTRRVLFAKQLLHDTRLPMAEVALAAGFGSVRRFNETFRDLFDRPPSALRRIARDRRDDDSARDGVTLRLAYRPPYDWPGMLAALAARADAGQRMDRGRRLASPHRARRQARHRRRRSSAGAQLGRGHDPLPLGEGAARDRGAHPARVRPRRRHHHHRQPPGARSQARAADRQATRPARARATGNARRSCRASTTTRRRRGGHGTPMPCNICRMANHG